MCIDIPPLTDNAIPLSKTDLTKRFVRSPLTIAVITTFGLLPVSGMASQVIKPTGDMAISSSPSTPIDSIVYLDKSQDVVLTATDGTFYLVPSSYSAAILTNNDGYPNPGTGGLTMKGDVVVGLDGTVTTVQKKAPSNFYQYSVITVGHGSRTGQGSSLTIDGTLKLQNLELPSSVSLVNVGIDSHLKTSGLVIENCTQASYNLIQAYRASTLDLGAVSVSNSSVTGSILAASQDSVIQVDGISVTGSGQYTNLLNLDSTVEFTSSAGISVIGDEANPLVFTGRRSQVIKLGQQDAFRVTGDIVVKNVKSERSVISTDITSGYGQGQGFFEVSGGIHIDNTEITKNEVKTGYEISSFVDIENRQAPVLDNVQIRNSRHSATTSNKTAFNAVRFDLAESTTLRMSKIEVSNVTSSSNHFAGGVTFLTNPNRAGHFDIGQVAVDQFTAESASFVNGFGNWTQYQDESTASAGVDAISVSNVKGGGRTIGIDWFTASRANQKAALNVERTLFVDQIESVTGDAYGVRVNGNLNLAEANSSSVVSNIRAAGVATGIYAYGGASAFAGQTTVSAVEGDTAVGIHGQNVAFTGGLQVSGVNGQTSSFAILAQATTGNGIVIDGADGIVNVVEGDLVTQMHVDDTTHEVTVGKINAAFRGADSHFKGATDLSYRDGDAEGQIDLAFKDSRWDVTKSSNLTSLSVDNSTLAVSLNLSEKDSPDTTQIDVKGEASGTFNLALTTTGVLGEDFVRSQDWILQQDSGNLTVGEVLDPVGAALDYSVRFFEDGAPEEAEGSTTSNGQKGQWYVVVNKDPTDPDNPGTDPEEPPISGEVEQVLALGASVNQGLGMLSETEDLRMRMGDIRNGDTDGLWVRTYARKDSAHGSFGNGFEQDTYGIHLGADHVVKAGKDASWLIGGAFHYGQSDMDGTADAAGGSADVDQYTFKAYATYMKDNGAFVDLVLHAGYYDTELTGLANNKMAGFKADYSNWGYGVSAEVGHRFEFGESASAWYVEPTAQLTWFHAEGKDFTTSTGLAVSQGDADFITGRLGAAMGKTFALGTDSAPLASYLSVGLKGGMLYQFDGDQTITAHGTDGATVHCDAMDLKGARAYYGLTADWKIDDAWRVYGQISREEGSGYTKDYDASIGVRYAF